ncbi:ABC transporter [Candidatus Liberibacter solanacearum]|uniref:ABC-type transport system involved in resistance to organic solvent, permease component n=1 Tax=Candidatus Liberibacter solanacearum TaxID=556287 RepID=A0A094Z1R9_9HYPH|nr:ABC transporter permease [Candidatus Liberibacter solanacearum]KGB27597.1 ABC transporter [Candidatus Liberibacter solanacearum]KJZ80653.1 ABC transporter [Candidatus Liberibacter solanacearum]KJZ81360.1 ABC-type transport system involved in resistance to organic solvent, permease component [Candidatus Liberibacter solanacearum]KQC48813.1 ABC transporter [Candidatus Liberibacter solanacearum]
MKTKLENSISTNIISSTSENGVKVFRLTGSWRSAEISKISKDILITINKSTQEDLAIVDLLEITEIDTIGVAAIIYFTEKYRGKIQLQGMTAHMKQLFSIMSLNPNNKLKQKKPKDIFSYDIFKKFYHYIRKKAFKIINNSFIQLHILGLVISNIGALFVNIHKFKEFFPSLIRQIYYVGVTGVPVIILISFVTGAVIAQQGAFQLSNFGAEIFAIDLMSILQLREIGVLLTAVMVAGRSGSAIVAEIGSMKINEEIDSIKTIGIDLVRVLISPRIWALIISLPLLTILANCSAIVGASIIIWKYYDIPFSVFFTRFHSTATLGNVFTGLIKAPFMACAIGIVAMKEGFGVGTNSDSLGERVTTCVVQSISMVIIIDSLFAIFYFAIGI